MPKWSPWVLLGLILVLIFGPQLLPGPDREKLGFEEFITQVTSGKVDEVKLNNATPLLPDSQTNSIVICCELKVSISSRVLPNQIGS